MSRKFQYVFPFGVLMIFLCLQSGCSEIEKKGSVDTKADKSSLSANEINTIDAIPISKGKIIFKDSCMVCHAIFKTDNLLAGIMSRSDTSYLKLYLTKQDSLVKANDKRTIDLIKQFASKGNAHNFPFSEDDLRSIFIYLKHYSP